MMLGIIVSLTILKPECCLFCLTDQGNGRIDLDPSVSKFSTCKKQRILQTTLHKAAGSGAAQAAHPAAHSPSRLAGAPDCLHPFAELLQKSLQRHAASYFKQMSRQCFAQKNLCIVVKLMRSPTPGPIQQVLIVM